MKKILVIIGLMIGVLLEFSGVLAMVEVKAPDPQRSPSGLERIVAANPTAARPAPDVEMSSHGYRCRGTDPFWSLKIDSNRLEFEVSGVGTKVYENPTAAVSSNSPQVIQNFSAMRNNGDDLLTATMINTRLQHGTNCSDGMSEQVYDFSVIAINAGKIFDGCCWLEE